MNNINRIQRNIEYSKITIDKIKDHLRDDCLSCQLRQIVTTNIHYPNKIQYKYKKSYRTFSRKQIRIAWINIPLESTIQSVEDYLKNLPTARIYQILTTDIKDILTEGHYYYLDLGELFIEDLKDKYALKTLGIQHLSITGKKIYRNCIFSETIKEDIINIK